MRSHCYTQKSLGLDQVDVSKDKDEASKEERKPEDLCKMQFLQSCRDGKTSELQCCKEEPAEAKPEHSEAWSCLLGNLLPRQMFGFWEGWEGLHTALTGRAGGNVWESGHSTILCGWEERTEAEPEVRSWKLVSSSIIEVSIDGRSQTPTSY